MGDRIQSTVAALRVKLAGDGTDGFSTDEEFYYTVGQLAYYLMSQSETNKKTGELYEPFLRARTGQQLKKRLDDAFSHYKHKITTTNRKFNKMMSMVNGYVPEQGNQGDAREMMMAGLFADNLLYEKSV